MQQRRVHQRAGFHNQALLRQPPADQSQPFCVQAMCAPPLAEAPQPRFIRPGVLQAQADKAPPAQPVANQFLALRVGQALARLKQTHLEERQRRAGRTSRGRRIHRLQRFFQWSPVQLAIQPGQKIIRRRGDHQAVQKSQLRGGCRLQASRTQRSKMGFQELCRGLDLLA